MNVNELIWLRIAWAEDKQESNLDGKGECLCEVEDRRNSAAGVQSALESPFKGSRNQLIRLRVMI
jgi:hypothetical protein